MTIKTTYLYGIAAHYINVYCDCILYDAQCNVQFQLRINLYISIHYITDLRKAEHNVDWFFCTNTIIFDVLFDISIEFFCQILNMLLVWESHSDTPICYLLLILHLEVPSVFSAPT